MVKDATKESMQVVKFRMSYEERDCTYGIEHSFLLSFSNEWLGVCFSNLFIIVATVRRQKCDLPDFSDCIFKFSVSG